MTALPLARRAVIRLSPQDTGEDVVKFLQGLVTNDVSGDLPVYAALLSAQGKTMFDFLVWRDGVDLLLDCEADHADELVKRLSLYRLRRKIAIARDPAVGVWWSPDSAEGAAAAPDPRLALLGWRGLGPAASEGAETGDADWLAHRLACGVAEGRDELGDVLWLETNAIELNGVSFTKGCYVGQENTARMNWRQKVNRRLVVVPLDRSEEKRRKVAHSDLGYAVDHLRVDDIAQDLAPAWLPLGSGV
ncbi:YgfZ/GcvT domain-containing protein [Aurantiacibacter suaedae]|uniref:CAF17-like 4Fe-4S cluster assembly/insertion protein YgfZ n=1 Tax=Aurantiacibacter suaedae TaxID=2545755 RepID=UPI0010F628EF|nr:folate-binding protein YgfZ [Aurantiacibacter suaedae]